MAPPLQGRQPMGRGRVSTGFDIAAAIFTVLFARATDLASFALIAGKCLAHNVPWMSHCIHFRGWAKAFGELRLHKPESVMDVKE